MWTKASKKKMIETRRKNRELKQMKGLPAVIQQVHTERAGQGAGVDALAKLIVSVWKNLQ